MAKPTPAATADGVSRQDVAAMVPDASEGAVETATAKDMQLQPMSKSEDVIPPGSSRRGPSSRPLSRRLVRAAGERGCGEDMTVEALIGQLGDRSFGWCIVLFSLVNLIPMPFGTMVTALPLILVAVQMALGFPRLRLPKSVMRREIRRKRFQMVVMRLRPVMRPIERVVRARYTGLFNARNEQVIGVLLLAVAIALFLPFPLSGWLPAISLLVTGIGLVERDGLVMLAGLVMGAGSVAVTIAVGAALFLGVQLLAA